MRGVSLVALSHEQTLLKPGSRQGDQRETGTMTTISRQSETSSA